MTLTLIAVISLATNIARNVFEVPSGILSDRWGRIRTVQLIPIFYLIALGFFMYSNSLFGYIVAGMFFGITLSFFSGSMNALLYDSLLSLKRESTFKRTLGRIYIVANIGGVITAALSGFLYVINPLYPFITTSISIFLLLIASLFLIEPSVHKNKGKNNWQHIKETYHLIRKSKDLIFILVFSSTISFILFYLFFFGQLYLEEANFAIQLIGIVYGARLFIEGLGNYLAIDNVPSNKKSFRILALLLTALLLVWLFNPLWWILFIFIFGLAGVDRLIRFDYIHTRIDSTHRASIESMISFITGIFFILFVIPINYVGELYGLTWSFALLSLISLGLFVYTLRS